MISMYMRKGLCSRPKSDRVLKIPKAQDDDIDALEVNIRE